MRFSNIVRQTLGPKGPPVCRTWASHADSQLNRFFLCQIARSEAPTDRRMLRFLRCDKEGSPRIMPLNVGARRKTRPIPTNVTHTGPRFFLTMAKG